MNSGELLQRYLLGIASEQEVEELEVRLQRDEALQDEFLLQAELDARLRQEAEVGVAVEEAAPVVARRSSGVWKWVSAVSTVAAVVLVAVLALNLPFQRTAVAHPSLGDLAVDVSLAEQNVWAAAGRGDLAAIRRELQSGVLVDARMDGELTPLHVACLYGRLDAAELLLAEGADVSLTDHEGNAALHIASFLGHEDLVRALLLADAEPTLRNELGFSSSDLVAIEWGDGLEEYYRRLEGELHTALDVRRIQAVRPTILALLTEASRSANGGPPTVGVHQAVVLGNVRAVRQHVAAGTDLNAAEDLGGSTPLMLAAIYGHGEIARVLVDAGADLELENKSGDTVLYQASFFCRPEIVELLLRAGADPSRANSRGLTPLDAVTVDFDGELRAVYEHVYQLVGLELDIDHVTEARQRVASVLKSHQPVQ